MAPLAMWTNFRLILSIQSRILGTIRSMGRTIVGETDELHTASIGRSTDDVARRLQEAELLLAKLREIIDEAEATRNILDHTIKTDVATHSALHTDRKVALAYWRNSHPIHTIWPNVDAVPFLLATIALGGLAFAPKLLGDAVGRLPMRGLVTTLAILTVGAAVAALVRAAWTRSDGFGAKLGLMTAAALLTIEAVVFLLPAI